MFSFFWKRYDQIFKSFRFEALDSENQLRCNSIHSVVVAKMSRYEDRTRKTINEIHGVRAPKVYCSNAASSKSDNNRTELAGLFSHKGFAYRMESRVIRGIPLWKTKSTPIFNSPFVRLSLAYDTFDQMESIASKIVSVSSELFVTMRVTNLLSAASKNAFKFFDVSLDEQTTLLFEPLRSKFAFDKVQNCFKDIRKKSNPLPSIRYTFI